MKWSDLLIPDANVAEISVAGCGTVRAPFFWLTLAIGITTHHTHPVRLAMPKPASAQISAPSTSHGKNHSRSSNVGFGAG